MVKTFGLDIDNTSHHFPIQMNISYSIGLLKEQDKQGTARQGFKQKVHWSRFSQEEINEKFVGPFLTRLASFDNDDINDISKSTDKITKLIVTPRVNCKRHGRRAIYTKLPDDVKAACSCSKTAFDSWKCDELSDTSAANDNYCSKYRNHRKFLRKFLNKLEKDKIKNYVAQLKLKTNCFGNS